MVTMRLTQENKKHDIPEYMEELYTCGDCWLFAFHVHHALKRLGVDNSVVLVGEWWGEANTGRIQDFWWSHVMVRLDSDRYVDVQGISTRQEVKKAWGREIVVLGRSQSKRIDKYQALIGGKIVFEESRDYLDSVIESLLDTCLFV